VLTGSLAEQKANSSGGVVINYWYLNEFLLREDNAMYSLQATSPFDLLRREMDEAFYSAFRNWPLPTAARTYPALNIWEDEEAIYVEAELPGLEQDKLEVVVLGSELTIKGELSEQVAEGATLHRKERPEGRFTRVAHLTSEVDASKVHAVLKNGVLTITLPKAEAARPRKITVKAH
jgi:HSP20 family protein